MLSMCQQVVIRMLKIFTPKSFTDVFALLHEVTNFFGFNTFRYPSNSYKTSYLGVIAWIINSCYWCFACQATLKSSTNFNRNISTIGSQLIENAIVITVFFSLIISFLTRKSLFKLLKKFEAFDKTVKWIMKYYPLERQ